jgi:hypothetical protein
MAERSDESPPAFGPVNAEEPVVVPTCFYGGLRYSPGARIYADTGEVLECQFNGAWKPTGERKHA